MRRRLPWLAVPLLAAWACTTEREDEPAPHDPMPDAETFQWSDHPICFVPPPAKWRREPDLDGGRVGARFTLTGSVGERIAVSEFMNVRRAVPDDRELEIGDVVDLVRYRTDAPEKFEFDELEPDNVAGVDALRLDFRLRHDGRVYVGRELYFLRDDHLFVVRFQGLASNLDLFGRIVGSISFPSDVDPEIEAWDLPPTEPGTDRFVVGGHRLCLATPIGWRVEREDDRVAFREGVRSIAVESAPRADDWFEDAPHVVKLIDRDPRQVVARLRRTTVGGCDVLLVDTWDRHCHAHVRRNALIDAETSLLVVHMLANRAQMEDPTFDALVASVRLEDRAAPR